MSLADDAFVLLLWFFRDFSLRLSGVIKLSMVNARFGLDFNGFMDAIVVVGVVVGVVGVVTSLISISGESGVSGRFGDGLIIVGDACSESDAMSV